jgi:uncharacterized ion transporter superfamily protein YfcC
VKAEKKENMVKKRAYKKVTDKNKRLNKLNLVVLGAGLLLTVLGMETIGYYILLIGLFVFFTTTISGLFASGSFRKQR